MANLQYAAPEQRIRGCAVDGRADIYAVGLILNEMFTHTLPIGSNYKKIGDVNPAYAWLDIVVDTMLQQAPGDRPFPASTVATRILVAQKDWSQSQELLRLAEEKPNNDGPYQMATPTIRDAQYDAGELKVYLDGIDSRWFETWFNTLKQGQYNHAETVGYGIDRLRKYPPDCIALPISMSSSLGYNLKSIAEYMKVWITEATRVFNKDQSTRYIQEENERRRKKEAEINRLKKEAEISAAVKGLFD